AAGREILEWCAVQRALRFRVRRIADRFTGEEDRVGANQQRLHVLLRVWFEHRAWRRLTASEIERDNMRRGDERGLVESASGVIESFTIRGPRRQLNALPFIGLGYDAAFSLCKVEQVKRIGGMAELCRRVIFRRVFGIIE